MAAVRGSGNTGHATARCLRFPEARSTGAAALSAGGKVTLAALASDAAVIVLDEALEVKPAPLAAGVAAEPGLALTHVAYPGDRRFRPWRTETAG